LKRRSSHGRAARMHAVSGISRRDCATIAGGLVPQALAQCLIGPFAGIRPSKPTEPVLRDPAVNPLAQAPRNAPGDSQNPPAPAQNPGQPDGGVASGEHPAVRFMQENHHAAMFRRVVAESAFPRQVSLQRREGDPLMTVVSGHEARGSRTERAVAIEKQDPGHRKTIGRAGGRASANPGWKCLQSFTLSSMCSHDHPRVRPKPRIHITADPGHALRRAPP